jgi:hypothetical protein
MQDAGGYYRTTVAGAAERLGITKEAVRKRIARGTLRADKDADGTVRVYVPPSGTAAGTPPNDLVGELRDRVRFLEEQLRLERDAHGEARRIIAGLVQRIPELEAPQEPTQAAPDAPQAGAEGEGRGTVAPEPQAGAERPWWRRMFGG